MRQLVWHLWYVGPVVEVSDRYCCNTQGHRNAVVGQASCRMDVTRLEQRVYIKIAVLRGRNATVSLWGTMPFCTELSPSQYYYFDVGTLFYHSA